MQKRTYLALGIGVALYFLPHIENKLLFFCAVIVSSMLPDLFSLLPLVGKRRVIKFTAGEVIKPNDFLHTYTVCVLIAICFAFFYPILAFPFFLGYSFHLALDSFSVRGIKPFWPFNKISAGPINPGGKVENTIFVMFIIFDVALSIKVFA
ncbi:MAG: metal-dependent hydrolase [Nanoarchaeota archaeon]